MADIISSERKYKTSMDTKKDRNMVVIYTKYDIIYLHMTDMFGKLTYALYITTYK